MPLPHPASGGPSAPRRTLPGPVEAYVAAFTPRSMDPGPWSVAATPVRDLVRAARPGSVAQARLYLSTLVQFLRDPRVWTVEAGPPTLTSLVTVPALNAHLAQVTGLAARTVETRRDTLMVFARLLGHASPKLRLPSEPASVDAFVRRGVEHPLPVAHIVAARRTLTPRPTSDPLRAVWSDLRDSHGGTGGSNAHGARGGTLRPAAHHALLALTGPSTNGGTAEKQLNAPATTAQHDPTARGQRAGHRPAQPSGPSSAPGPATAPKPMSRRAALAAARQSQARSEAAEAYLAAPAWTLPDGDDITGDIRDAIASFNPQTATRAAWTAHRDLGMRLVYATAPNSVKVARSNCSYVALFLHWHTTRPSTTSQPAGRPTGSLSVEDLFAAGAIEAFLTSCPWSDRSKASARSLLRRIVRELNPAQAPATLKHHSLPAPYTATECARFTRLASHQPTPALTRDMCFIIGLGLGAGLDSRDLRDLRARHITETNHDGALADAKGQRFLQVTVPDPTEPSGRPGRTVPVRRGYEQLVRRALALHASTGKGPDDLVVGRVTDRHNFVGVVTGRAKSADPATVIEVRAGRLRNTWLVAAMCAPIPLADLLTAAGLTSARTITSLLPHCPPPTPGELQRVLDTLTALPDRPAHPGASTGDGGPGPGGGGR